MLLWHFFYFLFTGYPLVKVFRFNESKKIVERMSSLFFLLFENEMTTIGFLLAYINSACYEKLDQLTRQGRL